MTDPVNDPVKTLSEALLEFAGVAEGLPTDMAENHDHYLHGVPKRGACRKS